MENISTITDKIPKMNPIEEERVVDAAKKMHLQKFQLPENLPGEEVIKERNRGIVEIFTGKFSEYRVCSLIFLFSPLLKQFPTFLLILSILLKRFL